MGEDRNAYNFLVGKPEAKRLVPRPSRKWKCVIGEGGDFIQLSYCEIFSGSPIRVLTITNGAAKQRRGTLNSQLLRTEAFLLPVYLIVSAPLMY
jgi:hypothetical protein